MGDSTAKVFEVFLFLPHVHLPFTAEILRLNKIYYISMYGSHEGKNMLK